MRHTVLGLIVALGLSLHPVAKPAPWHATPIPPVLTQCIAVKVVHHHVVCTKRAPVTCTNGVCVG